MPYNGQGFSQMLWGNDRISNDVKGQLQQLMEAILGTQEGSGDYNRAVENMNRTIYGDSFTDWDARDALAAFFPQIANNGYRVTADDARNNSWDKAYQPPANNQQPTQPPQSEPPMQNTTGGQVRQDAPTPATTPLPQGLPQGKGQYDRLSLLGGLPGFMPENDQALNMYGGLMQMLSGMMNTGGNYMSSAQAQPYQYQDNDAEWQSKLEAAQKQISESIAQKAQGDPYQRGLTDYYKDRKNQILSGGRGRETQYWLQNKPQLAEDNPYLQSYIQKYGVKEGGM